MSYPNKTIPLSGLVLKTTDYQDRDLILHMVNENGLHAVYVKGAQSVKSKNRRLCQPGSQITAYVTPSTVGMPRMIHGDFVSAIIDPASDLLTSALFSFLCDLLMHSAWDPDLYIWMKNSLEAMEEKPGEAWNTIGWFLKRLLEVNGIAPFVDGCVACGSLEGLETFSIDQGGFLCRKCRTYDPVMPKSRLRSFRILFKAGQNQSTQALAALHLDLEDILFLARWFESHSQLRLPAIDWLQETANLDQKSTSQN